MCYPPAFGILPAVTITAFDDLQRRFKAKADKLGEPPITPF
jgi:hypothetical protein